MGKAFRLKINDTNYIYKNITTNDKKSLSKMNIDMQRRHILKYYLISPRRKISDFTGKINELNKLIKAIVEGNNGTEKS